MPVIPSVVEDQESDDDDYAHSGEYIPCSQYIYTVLCKQFRLTLG